MERFFVQAPSVNAVRRALGRAPGGARVVGRFDRETIECVHTMNSHSLERHWPIILSRLHLNGFVVVPRPRVTALKPSANAKQSVANDEASVSDG